MKKYIGYFTEVDENGNYVDDFSEWCMAGSKLEALQEFRSDYPDSKRYHITIC